MASVFLYAAYAVLGAALGSLLLPTRIAVRVKRPAEHGPEEAHVDCAVLAGLVGLRLWIRPEGRRLGVFLVRWAAAVPSLPRRGTGAASRRPAEPASCPGHAVGDKPAADGGSFLDRAARLVELLGRPTRRFLQRCPGAVRLSRLRLSGRFGCTDPAQTGTLHGYLQGLRSVHGGRVQLDLLPDFERVGLRGQVHLVLHFHLGYALGLLLVFGARVARRWLAARCSALSWRPRSAQHVS